MTMWSRVMHGRAAHMPWHLPTHSSLVSTSQIQCPYCQQARVYCASTACACPCMAEAPEMLRVTYKSCTVLVEWQASCVPCPLCSYAWLLVADYLIDHRLQALHGHVTRPVIACAAWSLTSTSLPWLSSGSYCFCMQQSVLCVCVL